MVDFSTMLQWCALCWFAGVLSCILAMMVLRKHPKPEAPYQPPPISEQEEKAIWRAYWLVNQDKFLSEYTEE